MEIGVWSKFRWLEILLRFPVSAKLDELIFDLVYLGTRAGTKFSYVHSCTGATKVDSNRRGSGAQSLVLY